MIVEVLFVAAVGAIVGAIAADLVHGRGVDRIIKRAFDRDDAARAQQFNRSEK